MSQPPTVNAPDYWNLLQWIVRPIEFLEASTQRYGDCFSVRFGNLRGLAFFSDPAAIEQIFTASAEQFDSGSGNWILRRSMGDNSILLLDGDRHRRERQLLMPPFHGERMRAYGQIICDIAAEVVSQWQQGQVFVARSFMQQISFRVILQAVFGLTDGSRSQALTQALDDMMRITASRFSFATAFFPFLQRDYGAWSPGGRFLRAKQRVDDLLYAEIRDRRQNPDSSRTDILSLLLAARDEAGQPMSDVELRDELITLLIAGHETTATALSWALYWIHLLPEVKEKLLAELNSVEDPTDLSSIVRLPYLSAVCSETLRIYPVAFVALLRITRMPVQVAGYDFPADVALTPCIYLTHHREDLYPNSKQFRPERFLERQFSPYEYLPFGGSNRRCIGAAFALYEMKLALATILSRCELELAETAPVRPIRRGVTISPRGGVKLKLKQRLPEGVGQSRAEVKASASIG